MRIEYEFLRVGSFVEPRRGHIYIDIGNQSRPGIIDTHGDTPDADAFDCSTSLIVAKPSLVTEWITTEELLGDVRLVMHENPDYDCIASSFLVRHLLEARAKGVDLPPQWHEWAPAVADSARRIDRGETRLSLPVQPSDTPLTPYLSMLALYDHVGREAPSPRESWIRMIRHGQEILGRAVRLARDRGIADLNVVDLRGALADLGNLESIIEQKVRDFGADATRIGLAPYSAAGSGDLDGVFALELPRRNDVATVEAARVACIKDPVSGAGFFKSVIRGAYADQIQATCIFSTMPADPSAGTEEWIRPVIAVDPDAAFDLRGLGCHLDALETDLRKTMGVPRAGRPRPGFDNSDPWYDGRGFAYTIVDAPRWGTILAPKAVLEELRASEKWVDVRLRDLVRESLADIRGSVDPSTRRKAFGVVMRAIEVWHGGVKTANESLYRDCVDVVAVLAERVDVESHERLVSEAYDLLLALLQSERADVRVAALIAAARNAPAVEQYVRGCNREDVLPLLAFLRASAPEEAARLAGRPSQGRGDELLLDAIAARARIVGRVEDQVLRTIPSLAARVTETRRGRASIAHLHDIAKTFAPPLSEILEPFLRQDGETVPPGEQPTATLEDIGHAIADGKVSQGARLLLDVLEGPSALAPERRPAVMQLVAKLVMRATEASTVDEAVLLHVNAIVARLRAICSVTEILQHLGTAVTAAAFCSSELVGILLRAAFASPAARWSLVGAALDGRWVASLSEARAFVLTADDAHVYRDAELLSEAAAASRSSARPASVCGAQRLAFLLLAARRSRGQSADARVDGQLDKMIAARDLSGTVEDERGARFDAAENLRGFRMLLAQELRHAAPDHFLLADAEAALAKTEMFARLISLAGPQDSDAGKAVLLLLRIGANLPEIDQAAVDELRKLRRSYRRGGPSEAVAEEAFATAVALESIRVEGHLVADPDKIRAAIATLAGRSAAFAATPIGEAAATALCDLEFVLEAYADVLEAATAKDERALDELSLRMLEASTVGRFVSDWSALQTGGCADIPLRLAAKLARSTDTDALRKAYSRVRGELGRAAGVRECYARAEKRIKRLAQSADRAGGAIDAAFQDLRRLLSIPASALDAAYTRLIDSLIARYDLHRARRRVDEYSFGRLPVLLHFCMSGWTVLIPLLFMAMFMAHEFLSRTSIVPAVDAAMLAVVALVLCVIALEVRHKRRSAGRSTVESLRYKLFLPQYVVPVLLGVYTAAMSSEVTGHLVLQLDDDRYFVLGGLLFLAAAWALGQMIHRHGGRTTARNVLAASARLFAYGFVIALVLNLLLVPLLEFEEGLHGRHKDWIASAAQEPQKVTHGRAGHAEHVLPMRMEPTGLLHVTLFPRHIVLDALFGMFIAIFLRGFWKMGEEEE